MDMSAIIVMAIGETIINIEETDSDSSGFSIRREYKNNSRKDGKLTSRNFVCCKEGKRGEDKRDRKTKNRRAETRTDCRARMLIAFNVKFVQATDVELATDCGIPVRKAFELSSKQFGGRESIGFTKVDVQNYIRTRRQNDLKLGDANWLMNYFQTQCLEDPSFFYAVQLDSSVMITNIFWADSKMISDYGHFVDVLTFDTTYKLVHRNRPFAVFLGLNYHRETVVFGVAFMYDETTDSFGWLFNTFLNAISHKAPRTILTDQDAAMAKALV
ncbi:protein FAR1-RELATED SEQUENCE 5-like [Cornus florida]|uniref:protein FAR1-RELATED SEQUENCE 5-like n=1 Tax=Cornus florida TaxID=4283 RepID=UPI0028A07BE1|nr:protein FAR1-RELATED SEQUENCE 5-like [Cornus florida]